MATVRHAFQSTLPDGNDPSLLQPSHWNDTHVITDLSGGTWYCADNDTYYTVTVVLDSETNLPTFQFTIGTPPTPSGEGITTEDGVFITTEDGDYIGI